MISGSGSGDGGHENPIGAPTRRLETLPYNNLNWRDFELFVAELIGRLAEFSSVLNHGASPDMQSGVDIIALRNSAKVAFECKRVQAFGASDFNKVRQRASSFAATSFVLVISIQAHRNLIDATEQAGWDLWDSRVLDRTIRQVPESFELVEGYFGRNVAKAFLGKLRPGVFLPASEFFKPYLRPGQVGDMGIALVNREQELAALSAFLASSTERVLVVYGPPGVGKTKLLYEVSRALSTREDAMHFVREASTLDDDAIHELPSYVRTIVVDDVYKVRNVDNLVSHSARSKRLKVIFTVAAGNESSIVYQLQDFGYAVQDIVTLSLAGLNRSFSARAIEDLCGPTLRPVTDMIYDLSAGIPLVIQIIVFLIKQGQQPLIDSLASQQHPVDVLLTKFTEVLAGTIGKAYDIPPADLRDAMQLLSAVGTVDIRTTDFREKAKAFLSCDDSRLANLIHGLEAAGLLIRSGSRSRIVPDLLRPFILQTAYGLGSLHTDFAERLFRIFGYNRQVLLSLATVDRMQGYEDSGLDHIWRSIEDEVKTARPFERVTILEAIVDLGYVLPREALRIVDLVMQNPADPDPHQVLRDLHEFTQDDVLKKVAPIIRAVAYSGSGYLRRCVQLLWQLGRDDEKRFSEPSAFDTLVGLASYDRYKSVQFNYEVLSEIEAINARPKEQVYRHLPIDVAAPVLFKTFESTENVGVTLTVTKMPVAARNVAGIRTKALDILAVALNGASLRAAIKAVEYLARCLESSGFQDEESDRIWAAENQRILDLLFDARRNETKPIVQAKIVAVLSWHAHLNADDIIRERCAEIIRGLEGTPSFDWYAALIPDVARHLPSLDVRADFSELQIAIDSLLSRVVERALEQKPAALIEKVARSLNEIVGSGLTGSAGWFFVTLTNVDFGYAKTSAEIVVAGFGSALGDEISPVIHRAWVTDSAWADDIIARIFECHEPKLYMSVAHALWMNSEPVQSRNTDAERRSAVLARLLAIGDSKVSEVALRAVATLMSIDKKTAVKLILSVNVGNESRLADELFANLRTVSPLELGADGISRVLSYMVSIQELDYWAMRFLGEIAEQDPDAALDVLLRRIESSDEAFAGERRFRAVPFGHAIVPHEVQFFERLKISEAVLRNALDRGFQLDATKRYWFSELVSNLALGSNNLFSAFESWVIEKDRERLEFVAESMHSIPADIMLANASFVASLIDASALLGNDCEQRVRSALFSAVIGGVRTGAPFEAMPQDVVMIESARLARENLILGSPASRFFEDVEDYGIKSIGRKKEQDIDVFGEPE